MIRFCTMKTPQRSFWLLFAVTNIIIAFSAALENYECIKGCQCSLMPRFPMPSLHAKCSNISDYHFELPTSDTLPIHSIDLSFLNISRLWYSIEQLKDLTSIDLSHNELDSLQHLGRRIKKLNLGYNRITSVNLVNLPMNLQVLNLQHNDITHIPFELKNLKRLQFLELNDNKINCSCQTLDVRNWLQSKPVFMENPVICSHPLEFKGQPWLQVKQSVVCKYRKSDWSSIENENEVMMGDQAGIESEDFDENEELRRDFLPIHIRQKKDYRSEFEGSANNFDNDKIKIGLEVTDSKHAQVERSSSVAQIEEQAEDGSGSGDSFLIIPQQTKKPVYQGNSERMNLKSSDDGNTNIFPNKLGIFGGNDELEPSVNEIVNAVVYHEDASTQASITKTLDINDSNMEEITTTDVKHAEFRAKDDTNATYFLLGIIILIVVGLMLFVAIKRCKTKMDSTQPSDNVQCTELLEINKKPFVQEINRNGIKSPAYGNIDDNPTKVTSNEKNLNKPQETANLQDVQLEPLLCEKKNVTCDEALETLLPVKESAQHEYFPITSRYPPPKSPRASKYTQNMQNESNNNDTEEIVRPSSALGRYSPVYSPETGRLKLKLTETPRPKTPKIVMHYKSSTNDIIKHSLHQGINDFSDMHVKKESGS